MVGGGSEGALGAPRGAQARKGENPGGSGGLSPPTREGPPQPHRPQRVDVDEASGVGGFVVPLHIHAAERKAQSLGWGGHRGAWSSFWGRERMQVVLELAAPHISACCHSSPAVGISGQGPCQSLGKRLWGPHWLSLVSPGPARDTTPSSPPWSLMCIITLPPCALAPSKDARPVPELSPGYSCPMPGRGQCPEQGTLPEDTPSTTGGFVATGTPVQCQAHPSASPKAAATRQTPTPMLPTSPKNTSRFPETANLKGGRGGGEIKQKKERVYNDFTSPDGLQKNLCAFIFAHSSGSDLLYNYVTFYLLCRGISTQLCLSQLSLGFL